MKPLMMIMALLGLFSFMVSANPASAEVLDVLKGRAPSSKQGARCCHEISQPSWDYAETTLTQDNIQDLIDLGTKCAIEGRRCVQIACSVRSEIVLCNDNDFRIEPNCDYLASYAQDIVDRCSYYDLFTFKYWVCGQEFDSDKYNIIVKRVQDGVGCPTK